ncbi:unnamed protein product [Macrosiphum euphorbiae]|uniref:Uncharacterized protein n=1 Tax=Macrosiphum euphorbiae TaxID=13131 RepID=A0AAV0Y1D2_9HEMI|nr:unnamed protein product [Macrosiphum euphorbiae]
MPKDSRHSQTHSYNGRGMRVYNAPVYHNAVPVHRPGGNARRCCRCQQVTWRGIVTPLAWCLRHRRARPRRGRSRNHNSSSTNNNVSGNRNGSSGGAVVVLSVKCRGRWRSRPQPRHRDQLVRRWGGTRPPPQRHNSNCDRVGRKWEVGGRGG